MNSNFFIPSEMSYCRQNILVTTTTSDKIETR